MGKKGKSKAVPQSDNIPQPPRGQQTTECSLDDTEHTVEVSQEELLAALRLHPEDEHERYRVCAELVRKKEYELSFVLLREGFVHCNRFLLMKMQAGGADITQLAAMSGMADWNEFLRAIDDHQRKNSVEIIDKVKTERKLKEMALLWKLCLTQLLDLQMKARDKHDPEPPVTLWLHELNQGIKGVYDPATAAAMPLSAPERSESEDEFNALFDGGRPMQMICGLLKVEAAVFQQLFPTFRLCAANAHVEEALNVLGTNESNRSKDSSLKARWAEWSVRQCFASQASGCIARRPRVLLLRAQAFMQQRMHGKALEDVKRAMALRQDRGWARPGVPAVL